MKLFNSDIFVCLSFCLCEKQTSVFGGGSIDSTSITLEMMSLIQSDNETDIWHYMSNGSMHDRIMNLEKSSHSLREHYDIATLNQLYSSNFTWVDRVEQQQVTSVF